MQNVDINKKRKKEYFKDPSDETFLLEMNKALQKKEMPAYRDVAIKHPFIFVFGLPRSVIGPSNLLIHFGF